MNTGAFGEGFPYSNFHDLNLDWIIKIAKDFLDQYTHIQETVDDGIESLTNKATELETLLQEWYNTHSTDIADQLVTALAELNTALTQTLNSFNTSAEAKAQDVIETIPADYTELSNAFQEYVMNPSKQRQEDLEYTTIVGKIISASTGEITTVDDEKFCITSPIPVNAGDRITINRTGKYGNACVAFYDSTDTFISAITNNQGTSVSTNVWRFTNYIVNVPTGTSIMRITWHSDYDHSFYIYPVLLSKLANLVIPLNNAFENYVMNPTSDWKLEIIYTTITNKVLYENGVITDAGNDKFCVTSPIPVNTGDRITITRTGMYGNACIAYYDIENNFISSIPNSAGVLVSANTWEFINYTTDVPENARIMRIAWHSDYTHTFKMYPKLLETLSDVILPNTEEKFIIPFFSYISGSFIQDGVKYTGAGSAWQLTTPIPVEPGQKYVYAGYMNFDNQIVTFYSNGSIVSGINADIGQTVATNIYYNNFEFEVPENVDSMELGLWRSGDYQEFSITLHTVNLISQDYKPWRGLKWVCVGDSLTSNGNQTTSKRYYDYIQDRTSIYPVIMGADGSGYKRGENNEIAFYQRIQNCPTDADVITIFGSFNDLGSTYPLGTKTDTGTTTIAGCINTTLDNLFARFPLANVGLVSPSPWDTRWSGAPYADTTNAYVKLIKDICEYRSIPYCDMYHESGLRPWDETFRQLAYSHDSGSGTHPDETGHKILSTKFEAFLSKLLLR